MLLKSKEALELYARTLDSLCPLRHPSVTSLSLGMKAPS